MWELFSKVEGVDFRGRVIYKDPTTHLGSRAPGSLELPCVSLFLRSAQRKSSVCDLRNSMESGPRARITTGQVVFPTVASYDSTIYINIYK